MEGCGLYTAGTAPVGGSIDLNMAGNGDFAWSLNDWRWDGNRFLAMPVNGDLSNNSPSSSDDVARFVNVNESRNAASEKRKRVAVLDVDFNEPCAPNSSGNAAGGMNDIEDGEERSGKKGRVQGSSSCNPSCQVEGCSADLTVAKDYHRRHKVCEMHAKASTAVVRNAVQRFCQQCSRFHHLQEFDEGKRSCRRRLAGHNRRRRKAQPEAVGGNSLSGGGTSGQLLINLLKVLAGLHSDSSERSGDKDLLFNILRGLASLAGSVDTAELSRLLQESQSLQKLDAPGSSSEATKALHADPVAPASIRPFVLPLNVHQTGQNQALVETSNECVLSRTRTATSLAIGTEPCRAKFLDFDLNDTYNDTEESEEGNMNTVVHGLKDPSCPSWMMHETTQSSPQVSGNTDSASTHSLPTSNGDTQCRTDKMIIKLFNREPEDLPVDLRSQIVNWLNSSPTDMESYIRPGCVVLTLYLRLAESNWTLLRDNLRSHLCKLLGSSDNFWCSGWIFAMVQHRVAFIYNGRIMAIESLSLRPSHCCKILCIRPVAVPCAAVVTFNVKGYNLVRPSSRVLCSFEGSYLFEDSTVPLFSFADNEGQQEIRFNCSLPDSVGRGFIEIDENGFSNGFFPFIVAEQELCSEISELEDVIESSWTFETHDENITRKQALEFLNELGWLLQRVNTISSPEEVHPYPAHFHLSRYRSLIAFAMNHDWCAVVKNLLDILFRGMVELNGKTPLDVARSECLLHSAVCRRCEPMVKLLLRYKPDKYVTGMTFDASVFRPDASDHLRRTPLHIAAASSSADGLLGALTDDPGMVGLYAWRDARDIHGFTPEDYARQQGHGSYLLLIQKKIEWRMEANHVVVGIPTGVYPVVVDGVRPEKTGFEISNKQKAASLKPYCNLCRHQLSFQSTAARRGSSTTTFLYRPALFSLVAIAVVCVCVGLIYCTSPKVRDVTHIFRWELLKCGSI